MSKVVVDKTGSTYGSGANDAQGAIQEKFFRRPPVIETETCMMYTQSGLCKLCSYPLSHVFKG